MLIFVCALFCEAESLIQHFDLKRVGNELPFPIYANGEMQLIITGVGKMAAAIACAYLGGKYSHMDVVWMNVGICGGQREIGTPFLAHKIFDEKKSYFPSFVFPLPCQTLSLQTVDFPQKNISNDFLVDMEGLGFFAACSQFSSAEMIHCLKIVSDCDATILDKATVAKLIQNHLFLIETIATALLGLRVKPDPIKSLGLTTTETHKVQRLLQQCHALGLTPPSQYSAKSLEKFVKSHVPTYIR